MKIAGGPALYCGVPRRLDDRIYGKRVQKRSIGCLLIELRLKSLNDKHLQNYKTVIVIT